MEFAGTVYHLLDWKVFLSTLGQVCGRTSWQVHAWALTTNHYHLLVETPQPNLVAGMRWFQMTYTVRFNRPHRLTDHQYTFLLCFWSTCFQPI
jgi:putative transposase